MTKQEIKETIESQLNVGDEYIRESSINLINLFIFVKNINIMKTIKKQNKMIKHFTVLETGSDAESPMIGTILNITDTELGQKQFKERFLEAVAQHFDTDDLNHSELPDMFTGTPYEEVEIEIEIEGLNYEVIILETWIH